MAETGEIIFVTGNANKLAEVNAMLQGTLYRVNNIALDLEEVQGSLDEVSINKCKAAAALIKGPVLVEDTALCFDALKELPGPYIKWFMKAVGHDGLNRMLVGFDDKGAKAVCTFAFTEGPDHQVKLFRGTTQGTIVPARGDNNFGWDPIFEPEGYSETYAEMDRAIKNKISHRSKALKLLVDFLEKRVNEKKP